MIRCGCSDGCYGARPDTEPRTAPLTRCEPSRLLRGSYRDLDSLQPVKPCMGWRVTVHEPEMVTSQTRGSATGQRGERGAGGYGDPGRRAAEMLISMVFDEQQQEPVKGEGER